MTRHLFTFASVISLLLCMATVTLWVRSHSIEDDWIRGNWADPKPVDPDSNVNRDGFEIARSTDITLVSERGGLWVLRSSDLSPSYSSTNYDYGGWRGWRHQSLRPPAGDGLVHSWRERWIGSWISYQNGIVSVRKLMISHLMVAILFTATPFAWLIRLAATIRRKRSGCCQQCGYDLRASPDRCPECGTVVNSQSEVIA